MHSILSNNDQSWNVGLWGRGLEGRDVFGVMFEKLKFNDALRLCNLLNGGMGQLESEEWASAMHKARKQ